MNIGFDIDGVLTNEEDYLIECMTKYAFENNLPEMANPLEYETRKFENWQKLFDLYQKHFVWEYAKNAQPRLFASEIINKLKNDGHKIFIITSRRPTVFDVPESEIMKQTIKNWLAKNNIYYDEIFFEIDKTIKIKELNIDIMVEDSPKTIPIFAKLTHIFCFDNRYNANLVCENMTRVFSFYDLYNKILKFKNM